MTTAEEENYLRSSFLLLKGGTFAARKVVIREEQKEIQKSGRDLDDLLMDNKGRLEHEFRNYKHREKLFPADGKTKVEDWDISLLTGVLRIVFRSTLSEDERKAVRSIKLQRNDVYAHRATADLSCDDYSDVCDELKEALRNLTSEFSEGVKTECEDIINSCLNGPIDIKSHIEHLKRVSDTDNMFRTILEKIDKNGKETMENIKEVVGQQHVSLKKDIAEDISNSQDVICRTVRDTQLTKAGSTDFTTLVRDAVQQALQEQRSTRKVKVVDSELEVSGKDVDKPNIDLAEQMIKTVTNEAIRRMQTSEELVDIREAIQEILDEIASRTGVKALEADIACVVIRFSYKTYEQLLKLLVYLDSDDIKLRLAKLAALLSHRLQTKEQLHLSTSLSIKCLQNILDELETESRSEYKRTVRLPIQFESVEGMAHVWNYFENGGATNSLNKLSEALSAKLGTKIKLTSSLNVDQFKSALDDFGSENTSTRLTDQLRVGDDTTQSVDEDNQDTKSNESQKNIGGIELYSSISGLAPRKLYELQNILDSNPDDTNWRALAYVVHKKYNIRPYLMDGFKREGSASSALLKHLQEQGMTVKELQDYLNEIGVKFCLEDKLQGRKSSISIKTCHGEEWSEVRLEADPEDDGNAQSKHQLLFSDIEKIEDMLDALQLADHYGVLIDNLETLDEVKKALYLHFQNEEGKKAVTSFPHVFKDTTYRSRELRSIMTKFLDIIHKKGPYKIASQLVEEMLKTDGTSENITDDCETNIDGQNCAIIFAGDPSAETSCILNLVLGEDLLPLDDCFSPPCTVIRYSPQRSVRVVHAHGEPDVLHDLDGEVIKRLRKTTQIMDHLELTLPHPILQSGVILIDDTSLFDLDLEFLLTHTLKQTAVLGLVYVSWIDSVGSIQDRVCGLLTILDRPVSPESDNYFHTSFDPKSALFVFNHLDRIPKKHIDFVKVHAIGKLLKYWPSFEESQVVFCSMLKTHQDGNFDKQLLVKLNNLFTSAVQILTKQSYKWMEKVIKQTTHYLVTTERLLNMTEHDRRRECEVLERQLNNLKDKLSVFRKLKENGNVVFVKLNEYIKSKPCEQILTQSWSVEEIPSVDSEVVTFQWPTIWMGIRKAFYDKLNECIEKWYIEERSISSFEEELRVTKNDLEKELKSIEKEMHSDMAHKVMELSESLLPPVPDKMSVLLHWKRVWGTKLFGRQMDHSVKEIEMKISEYTADPLKFAETIAMEMYQGLLCQFSQIESELIFSEGKRTGLQQIPLVEHFAKCFVEYIDALEERLLDIIMANCKLLNQLGGTAEEYRRDKQQYENMMWSMITLQNSLMEYNEKVSDSDICSGPKVIRFKSPTHIVTTINKSEEERESDEHLQGHGLMSYVTANKDVGYSRDTKEVDFQWQKSSKIGEGRFGKVYSVVNVRRGELMTMKEMIFALSDEQYHINDIIDAVKILEGVNHPNLVKYYGVEVHKV
ncbi:uncharacterized protein LOC123526889 [Mercenaria mercenaria]|uniref:uncharacterized protein LOC123526889 n=1 Tax=Mercenaria mercenaria TaxID=6596 RepID=UPI00234F456D|nr:uncharacterized protein LOC123526889 [Mercenaria mercenaria]